jgi:prepilin-type N-terminal cleavage/methylation domain-containing protein/prepilin-type processing-associated H-X9-DG protein
MDGRAPGRCNRGFTLVELLTVVGLVALLVALFLPVAGRMRATARSAVCLANLKQIGTAWTMSISEDHGRLVDYEWLTPATPDVAWNGYWTGAMDRYKVSGATLLCPEAAMAAESEGRRGYGSATLAWTGRLGQNGSAIRMNDKTFREGSYGFNRWLGGGGAFGSAAPAMYLSEIKDTGNVPVFIDCAYADARPANGKPDQPVEPPPDLAGTGAAPGKPEHWKFTLARHGRGVNVYRLDGSAAWVRLEELYLLGWKGDWIRYRLPLPRE